MHLTEQSVVEENLAFNKVNDRIIFLGQKNNNKKRDAIKASPYCREGVIHIIS